MRARHDILTENLQFGMNLSDSNATSCCVNAVQCGFYFNMDCNIASLKSFILLIGNSKEVNSGGAKPGISLMLKQQISFQQDVQLS
jgi:hypothetical protein